MIQMPRRSVTRFFIPLIDVLTLLFCIFLLMPAIKPAGEGQDSTDAAGTDSALADATSQGRLPGEDQQDLKTSTLAKGDAEHAELDILRKERLELEQLRKQKIDTLQQRLFIRVLEIDADTGKLFYREADQVLEVRNQADALQLTARHKQEAGNRELYYLFLYPRRLTGYPEERQVRQYESWFKNVAHGTDNPLSER